jgi:hypothetical protein
MDKDIEAIFNNYPETQWHSKLIAHVSQMIAMTSHDKGLAILNVKYPELLTYYREVFLPACEECSRWFRYVNLVYSPSVGRAQLVGVGDFFKPCPDPSKKRKFSEDDANKSVLGNGEKRQRIEITLN